MINPTIKELSKDKYNRYTLVIAAAKAARYVTGKQMIAKEAESTEQAVHEKAIRKLAYDRQPLKKEYLDEKPVKAAIEMIDNGDILIGENAPKMLLSDENGADSATGVFAEEECK